jgi:integrase/recombinase XerD
VQGATFETLIGLLAATGLRPGEALELNVDDVDLHAQVLMIQGWKGGKSRLVPITPSAAAGLAQYAEQRDRLLAHRKTDLPAQNRPIFASSPRDCSLSCS